MATNLLTATRPSPDFGLDPALLKVTDKDGSSPKAEKEVSKEKSPIRGWHGQLKETFLQQLPVAVLSFERPPWDQLLPKVGSGLFNVTVRFATRHVFGCCRCYVMLCAGYCCCRCYVMLCAGYCSCRCYVMLCAGYCSCRCYVVLCAVYCCCWRCYDMCRVC